MNVLADIILGGGSLHRRHTDTHAVSMFHIPGYQVSKADIIKVYWPDEEAAKEFVDKYKDESEMACMCVIEDLPSSEAVDLEADMPDFGID